MVIRNPWWLWSGLASAPTIKFSAERGDDIAGLNIENGFAQSALLLDLLDLSLSTLGLVYNQDKLAMVRGCP